MLILRQGLCINRVRMMSSVRVGIIQLTSTNDKERNKAKSCELLKKAKSYGAQVAFLPECFDFIGESAKETNYLAEDLNEENGIINYYKSLAKELNLSLSLGGCVHSRMSLISLAASGHTEKAMAF